MFSKPKGWLPAGLWKPKNPHSLEHMKYLYNVLSKIQTVNEGNRGLLVETLRQIAEILIWGDQNDSSVFDFFLEKNMLGYFLKIMRQKYGRYVCVQLLQTLNILFENISNETSLYYLLSNNHINSIIVHKFDFSDEEIMAYYISFLKTLSLKLNTHTVHFFYNEHTNDFPLYTEGIKFFNHSEIMVRNAVRTLTLNVYKELSHDANDQCWCLKSDTQNCHTHMDDKSMLKFIKDKTAAPYFFNLVWFIGSHILELDSCVRNDAGHNSRNRLGDLVAEHLDHMHYMNDILNLGIVALNDCLTDHLLNRLLIPLYVYSLTKRRKYSHGTDENPHISSVVSLFLLTQVFLIINHAPLVRQLAGIVFNGDIFDAANESNGSPSKRMVVRGFAPPNETLEQSLEISTRQTGDGQEANSPDDDPPIEDSEEALQSPPPVDSPESPGQVFDAITKMVNVTDEEKAAATQRMTEDQACSEEAQQQFQLTNRPYLEAIFNALECTENDYETLIALCLLYSLGHNEGINQELMDSVMMPTERSASKYLYNVNLIERLVKVIMLSCKNGSKVRLATLELCILLLKQLLHTQSDQSPCFIQDSHMAWIESAREESILQIRNFYKGEEIFLDMFEDEYRQLKSQPLNVEYLTMDHNILLTPTGTPMTGIEFTKRLPCGEVERARRAIRVFFLLRELSLSLRHETDRQLPLTKPERMISTNGVLDLNNSDLIACTVMTADNQKVRRFLAIDIIQMILVEPDTKRLGWGVARFVGFLQDIEVSGDRDDSRILHITIHKQNASRYNRGTPLLSAKLAFDDHIRCMAAKQRLTKGRIKARMCKMQCIARLLELPDAKQAHSYNQASHAGTSRSRRSLQQSASGQPTQPPPTRPPPPRPQVSGHPQPSADHVDHDRVRRSSLGTGTRKKEARQRSQKPSARHSATVASEREEKKPPRSREGSPRPLPDPADEMIPLEDFSKKRRHKSDASAQREPRPRHHSSSDEGATARRTSSASPHVRRLSGPLQRPLLLAHSIHGSPLAHSSHGSRPRLVRQDSGVRPGSSEAKAKQRKEKKSRSREHSGTEPKSLTPAKVAPVSLTDSVEDLKISTKILPPANTQHIRHLVTDSSSEDDGTTETSFTEVTADKRTASSDLFESSDQQPAEGVADVDGEITKLAQMVTQQFSTDDDNPTLEEAASPQKVPGAVEHL